MKIVHIITGLNVGGAEHALKRLVLASSDRTVVVSLTQVGEIGELLQQQGIEVYALGMNNVFGVLKTVIELRKLLIKLRPDIVQTWLYHADLIGGISAKLAHVKIVVWGVRTTKLKKGSYATSIIRFLLAALSYVLPTKILCVAKSSLETHRALGYAPAKLHIINNGCDAERFSFNAHRRSQLRERLGITEQQPLIGTIARFSQDKGPDLFVESAKKVAKYFPQVRFLMLGPGMDADNQQLDTWLDNAGISDKTFLLGESDNIAAYLSSMDVFCLTSRTEGFPNALLEAMAAECICVATPVGDVGEILQPNERLACIQQEISHQVNNQLAVVVSQVNSESIAQGMMKVLKSSPTQRQQMRELAYQRVVECYSQNQTNDQYKKFYKALYNGELI